MDEEVSLKNWFVPLTNKKVIGIIFVVCFVVFFNALFNGFVWDDKAFIQYNPDIDNLNIFHLFGHNMFNNVSSGHYRPITAIYCGVMHVIFGDNVFFYHIVQTVLHAINSSFVFLILRRFFRIEISFFLALLFIVHPVQVEAVSYIGSTDSGLLFLFGLSAFYLQLAKEISTKRMIAIFALLLGCVMTKESSILFILMIFFYNIFFTKKNIGKYIIGTTLIVGLYLFLRIVVYKIYFSHITLAPMARASMEDRFTTIPAVIFYYIKTLFFPKDLAVAQQWIVREIGFSNFYFPLFIVLVTVGILIYFLIFCKKRFPKYFFPLLFFTLWLVLGMGLFSQFYPLDMTVSDRWFYFPFIGFIGIVGVFASINYSLLQKNKSVVLCVIFVILTILAIRTMVRNHDWRDALSLYSHDVHVVENFDLENSMGGELNLVGRHEEAYVHFKKSVAIFPHETNLFNLGLSYEQKKDLKNAEKYYSLAYQSPSYGEVAKPHRHHNVTYERLSITLLNNNEPAKALVVAKSGIADYPNNALLWYLKAIGEYRTDNAKAALESARFLNQLMPNSRDAKELYENILNGREVKLL